MSILDLIVEKAVTALFDVLARKSLDRGQEQGVARKNVGRHLVEVVKWTERIQFFGMSSAESTDESTVGLDINCIPRKFRGSHGKSKTVSEESILNSREHHILLGDPGAGKTTTIKRLARTLLLEDSTGTLDTWQFPLIVRLRETDGSIPIVCFLADILGLKYEVRRSQSSEEDFVFDPIAHIFVGDERLKDILPEVLNSGRAVVFLDGLDEVPLARRESLESQIAQLARRLTDCKIIVSCRSGDYVHHIDGFEVVEICPLERSQVERICEHWLDDPADFLGRVDRLPARDLLDRPLFLAQMMVVYQNSGYLPEQPCALYRRLIRLMLEDWDEKRGVRRRSKYGNFDAEQKLEFLAALSYHLTCEAKVKRFSTDLLIQGYNEIHDTFSLPKAEAKSVVGELETHTGILVESGDDAFEFSHLSLQEYLCGYYLVRDTFSEKTIKYFREYPAPLAVAVALSANPSNWFASLVLHAEAFGPKESIDSFLSRLRQEMPCFSRSRLLGLGVLRLIFAFHSFASKHLEKLLELPNVRDSLRDALLLYAPKKSQGDSVFVLIELKDPLVTEHGVSTPKSGYIGSELLADLSG